MRTRLKPYNDTRIIMKLIIALEIIAALLLINSELKKAVISVFSQFYSKQ